MIFLPSISPIEQLKTSRVFRHIYNRIDFVMSNLLIGSSNVYRNYDRAVESGCFSGRNFTVVRCTKKAVFDSTLTTLTSAGLVVTSVLENFIAEACTSIPDDRIPFFARQQITAHV